MTAVFKELLNMSFAGSIVILAVLLIRLLFRKAPKTAAVFLWAVVFFRLLCPLTIRTPFSVFRLIPGYESRMEETVPAGAAPNDPAIQPDIASVAPIPADYVPVVLPTAAPLPENDPVPADASAAIPEQEKREGRLAVLSLLSWIWISAAAVFALASLIQYIIFRRRLRTAVPAEDGIYEADHLGAPFVCGIFRPRIYIPAGLSPQKKEMVLLHEKTHLRWMDPLFKLLGYACLILHWFNPFVWLAFVIFSGDLEMACDERVLAQLDSGKIADYAESLLVLSRGKRRYAAFPVSFAEADPKKRILRIADYKKPAHGIIALMVFVCVLLTGCFGTDPVSSGSERETSESTSEVTTEEDSGQDASETEPASQEQPIPGNWTPAGATDEAAVTEDEAAIASSRAIFPELTVAAAKGMVPQITLEIVSQEGETLPDDKEYWDLVELYFKLYGSRKMINYRYTFIDDHIVNEWKNHKPFFLQQGKLEYQQTAYEDDTFALLYIREPGKVYTSSRDGHHLIVVEKWQHEWRITEDLNMGYQHAEKQPETRRLVETIIERVHKEHPLTREQIERFCEAAIHQVVYEWEAFSGGLSEEDKAYLETQLVAEHGEELDKKRLALLYSVSADPSFTLQDPAMVVCLHPVNIRDERLKEFFGGTFASMGGCVYVPVFEKDGEIQVQYPDVWTNYAMIDEIDDTVQMNAVSGGSAPKTIFTEYIHLYVPERWQGVLRAQVSGDGRKIRFLWRDMWVCTLICEDPDQPYGHGDAVHESRIKPVADTERGRVLIDYPLYAESVDEGNERLFNYFPIREADDYSYRNREIIGQMDHNACMSRLLYYQLGNEFDVDYYFGRELGFYDYESALEKDMKQRLEQGEAWYETIQVMKNTYIIE